MVWFLLFTRAELDWLKIGAACKDLPPDIWTQTTQTLLRLGLIRPNRQGTSYRLTPAGYELLDRIGFPYARDKTYRCDPAVIQRRVQTAELMLFLDRLGADVFLQSPADKKRLCPFCRQQCSGRKQRLIYLATQSFTAFCMQRKPYSSHIGSQKTTEVFMHRTRNGFSMSTVCFAAKCRM